MYFWISAFDHRAIVLPKMHIMQWAEPNYPSVINKPAATGPAASDKFMTEATSMGGTTSNRLRSLGNLTNHRNTTQTFFYSRLIKYQVRLYIFEFRWKKAIGNSQKVIKFLTSYDMYVEIFSRTKYQRRKIFFVQNGDVIGIFNLHFCINFFMIRYEYKFIIK